MASAGVVGAAEVFTPSSYPAGTGISGTPAMWAFVWTGFALFVLVFLHLAIAGRGGRLWSTSGTGSSGWRSWP